MHIFFISLNVFSELALKRTVSITHHLPLNFSETGAPWQQTKLVIFIISDFPTDFYTIRPYIDVYLSKFGESLIHKISTSDINLVKL